MGIETRLNEAWNQGQFDEMEGMLRTATPQERVSFAKWVHSDGRFEQAPFSIKLKTVRVLTTTLQTPDKAVDEEVAKLADVLQQESKARYQGLTGRVLSVWDWVDWTNESTNALRANLPMTSKALFRGETRGIERAAALIHRDTSRQLYAHLWNLSNDQAEELVEKQPEFIMNLVRSGMLESLCVFSAKLKPETLMKVWDHPRNVDKLLYMFGDKGLAYLAHENLGLDFTRIMLNERKSGKNGLYSAIEHVGIDGLAFVADRLDGEDFAKAAFTRYQDDDVRYETFLLATSTHNPVYRKNALEVFANKLPEKYHAAFQERVVADYQRPLFQFGEAFVQGVHAGALAIVLTPTMFVETVREVSRLINEAKQG